MTNLLTFDFEVNKQSNSITVRKEFSAGRDLVWDAWTKKELLDQWWAPKPWKAETKTMEFKENGSWLYAMVGPEGERHWAKIQYDKIDKPNRFTGVDGFTDENGNWNTEMPLMKWDVSFKEKENDHTLVEVLIIFDNLKQLETIVEMGFKEGFTIALEGLEELLPSFSKK